MNSLKMYNKVYPLLSIGIIQIGQFIEQLTNSITLFIFLIQLLIGVLTIMKLWKEIKINNSPKTNTKLINEEKKKYKFLTGVLTVLKKLKK